MTIGDKGSGMNLPNKLTLGRFILTLCFLMALWVSFPYHGTLALVFFVAAALTDYYDGVIARRDHLITHFGILMDPLADKILICSAFIALVELEWTPAWMAIVIVSRELAITGMRLLAAAKNLVLAAERLGKQKTAAQITAVIAILVSMAYPQWGSVGQAIFGWELAGRPWVCLLGLAAQWVAVLLTAYSGLVYLWRNRELYLKDL